MAISDVQEYMHLTDEEIEQLGRELDEIRAEIEESRGDEDAAYINRLIRIQRGLAVAGRLTLLRGTQSKRTRMPAAVAGATLLGLHKILENMEIGHNVMHGQWDWMNDPEIHSSNWEWDTAQPAEQWKHSHNYVHHQFTNVLGYDNDIGYGILRMAREQKWSPFNLGQPVYNALLASLFQWGVALHDLDIERIRKGEKDPKEMKRQLRQIVRKGRNQVLKDYVVYPALAGRQWKTTLGGQRHGQPDPQPVVLRDHLLRPLPGRRAALHRGGDRGRDARGVVPPPDPRRRELQGRPAAAHHVRQPRLPDRAPPLPGPAEQPVRRDLGAGAGAVREVRHPLHDRAAPPAVRPGAAHDHQAVGAQRLDLQRPARAADARRGRRKRRSDDERPARHPGARRLVAGEVAGAAGVMTPSEAVAGSTSAAG